MNTSPLNRMERARVAEEKSPHLTHKVGACLCSCSNSEYQSSCNHWPAKLNNTIDANKKLGNASTTIHAEISALIQAQTSTNMADIYITDLPCPNCAKTMAEAGISNIYIDTNTHDTLLGHKMRPFFEQVSMLIFERAGLGVHEVKISKNTITTLLEPSIRNDDIKFEKAGCKKILSPSREVFREQIKSTHFEGGSPYAICIAHDNEGNHYSLGARANNAMGLTQDDARHINKVQSKYEPVLQPFNRLLAHCAYYNLRIKDGYFFASQCPTAREFVNMISYGLTHIYIDKPKQCRDKWGLIALKQLRDNNVIKITEGALQF